MKTLICLLFSITIATAQLSISRQGNQVQVDWPDSWILQSTETFNNWNMITNGTGPYLEVPSATAKFFSLVAPTNIFCAVRNGQTNHFVVPVGNNQYRSYVWLAAITEPLPNNPTFMVRSGQAHLHPPLITDTGIERSSESRGVYDNVLGAYCVTVDIQDPITTPLTIRVIGTGFLGYAVFRNP